MVQYCQFETRLGNLLVVWSSSGVCRAALGGVGDGLVERIVPEYPGVLRAGAVSSWAESLARYVDGSAPWPEVPVVLGGTVFQRRVWSALRRIPSGEVWTYAQLAAVVGSGPRAVASGCARNRIALAVPCHRVIRSDGQLSGYRWGPARKAALLEMERLTGG